MKVLLCNILILLLLTPGLSSAYEVLKFGVIGLRKEQHEFRIAQAILQEIAKKMDLQIELVTLPAKRATLMLKNGQLHAELARLSLYKDQVVDSIKIEEPFSSVPLYSYSLDQSIHIDDWSNLGAHKVVVVRGQAFIKTYLEKGTYSEVNSVQAALRFLQAQRADIYIGDVFTATTVLNSPEFKGTKIKRHSLPVASFDAHTFFSEKYPQYAKQYHKALRAIRKEGIYQEIVAKMLQ